jgi:adenosylcobinamide-phosphate guanylyltransferase
MCGGRGTRLDAEVEKPLFAVGGEPMVVRVADALAASRVEIVYAVVSPHAPETAAFAETRDDLETVETAGDGYVDDLGAALDAVELPVLTVAADLPLLAGDAVDSVLDGHGGADTADGRDDEDGSLTVCVPAALKRALGASIDATFESGGRELAPAGVNVVADADEDATHVTYDARVAVNVNRVSDAELAEELL